MTHLPLPVCPADTPVARSPTRTPPAPFPNPAGLRPQDVDKLLSDLASDWDEAEDLYAELTHAPDLSFAEFLRWCLAHRPSVSRDLARDFFSYWERQERDAVTHAEMVSLAARLDLGADPDEPGNVSLLHWFTPFFAADFAPFRALYREHLALGRWHPEACRAFQLADWLLGGDLPADEGRALGRGCAHQHYWSFNHFPGEDNRAFQPLVQRPGLADAGYRTVGLALLGPDGWRDALQALRDADPHWSFDRVVDVFDPLPLADAVPRLLAGGCTHAPFLAHAHADYVRRRPEPAAELLRVGRALAAQEPRPTLAELLLLEAARRLLDAGEPVPDDVDPLFTLTLPHRAPLPFYRAVLPRLPRERRLALIERDFAQRECRGMAVLALTDEELVAGSAPLRRALSHTRLNPAAFGQLGERGARVADEVLGQPLDAAVRPRVEHALLEAAAFHVQAGGAFDEGWSFYLILSPPRGETAESLYEHLPEPLRSDLLVEAVREYRVPSEVLDLVAQRGLRAGAADAFIAAYRTREKGGYPYRLPACLRALHRGAPPPDLFTPRLERLRARAALGPEPREPVYVCLIVPAEHAGPATSLTCFGGQPPVAAALRPKRSSRHVLTVDARDAPEIGARFPGARAVSFFAPRDPDFDEESHDDFFWRPWTEEQVAPALAELRKRRSTLVVHRVLVPTSTFTDEGDADLRQALAWFPGYLFGGPLTIQEDTAGNDPTFMAQLGEDLGFEVGDAGLLYSYTDHAEWDGH